MLSLPQINLPEIPPRSCYNAYNMKTIAFRTLGCRANQYDTQMMKEKLPQEWKLVPPNEKADIFCINTCTVTNSANSKSRQYIRRIKRKNPNSLILVTGCYAHTSPHEVHNVKGVDVVFGNPQKSDIAEIIKAALKGKRGIITSNRAHHPLAGEKITSDEKHTRAFLKIQDGCRKRCSFCKTTYARGPSRSKSIPKTVEEVKELVDNKYREVVFCGINLAEYGKGSQETRLKKKKQPLLKLLTECVKIKELRRIRLSSINLEGINSKLLKFFNQVDKACPYFHIPLQSGDDKILRKMGRGYTVRDYVKKVNQIKDIVPNATLGCDIMIGFPGETEENFANTCRLVEKLGFVNTHIFRYSKREGTPAASFKNQIPEPIKKKRADLLKKIAKRVEKNAKSRFIGRKLEVLIEEESPLPGASWRGYSKNFIDIHIQGGDALKPNKLVKVKVEKLGDNHGFPLLGRAVSSPY